MLITLAGLPGSGTSTVGREVAARLGLDHLDGGSVFRALAAEAGMSLAEFAAVAEGDDRIDRALDDRLTERARAGDVLLESRLSAWLVTRAGLPALRQRWIEERGDTEVLPDLSSEFGRIRAAAVSASSSAGRRSWHRTISELRLATVPSPTRSRRRALRPRLPPGSWRSQ